MDMLYSFQNKYPKIHPSVFITQSSEIIGDVEIGENASVWFNVVIRGDVHWIKIGNNTNIQDGSILHVTNQKAPLKIGNNVSVAHSVTLHGCTISDFVLVGMGAVILDYAEIGTECMIAAGSLITPRTKIPPRSMVMGSPAKVVRELTAEEIAFLHQSAENYKNYVNMYKPQCDTKGDCYVLKSDI